MSDLDDKLREIAAKLYNHDFFVSDLTPSSPILSHGDESVDSAIRELKQVFADAGYATVRKDRYRDEQGKEFQQYTIQYADGSGQFVRVPSFEYMTGSEWYERFIGEMEKLIEITHTKQDFTEAIIAASTAAGIPQSPETAQDSHIQDEAHSQSPQTDNSSSAILEP